jgi:thiol-disulfide isomerase/thioredoxin
MRFIVLVIFFSCYHFTQAQMNDTTLLIGKTDQESLKQYSWFNTEYDQYIPVQSVVDSLLKFAPNLKIMTVLGTWCSDSHELVPAFYKVASLLKLSPQQIEMIAVDRKKNCPAPDIRSLNIEYVPTFFVFYKGELKGKIVETVEKTIEQDMLQLLQAK